MIPSQSGQTPLARLVLFMICLAIAGSALAGAHYYAVDLPYQQKAAEIAPDNGGNWRLCTGCVSYCESYYDEAECWENWCARYCKNL